MRLIGIVLAGACWAQAPPAEPIEVSGPGVTVVVRSEDERALGQRVVALYSEVVGVLRLRLGRAPGGPVRVTLTRLGGGDGAGHTVGLATWSNRWIRIDPDKLGPMASLPAVLAHEVTHVVVGEATQGNVPDWFDEGVAEWLGATYGIADHRSLVEAAADGRLPSLEDLTHGFPDGAEARRVAYSASREAVELIAAAAGPDVIARILARCAEGRPFAEALVAESGHPQEHWDARLAESLAPGPGLVWRIFESNPNRVWWVLLGLGGLLAIYAAVVRTRRARARLEAVERAEAEARLDPDDAMTEHYAEHGDWEPEEDDESWRG